MKPSAAKVLDLLREAGSGGVSTGEFCAAYIGRAAARIHELRHAGYTIDQRPLDPKAPRGPQRYFLSDHGLGDAKPHERPSCARDGEGDSLPSRSVAEPVAAETLFDVPATAQNAALADWDATP